MGSDISVIPVWNRYHGYLEMKGKWIWVAHSCTVDCTSVISWWCSYLTWKPQNMQYTMLWFTSEKMLAKTNLQP